MVEEKQYKISEMTKMVQVEAHVLRYWEDELQLPIRRNNLGHRYYTDEDVACFLQIKGLKERGIQLKGIRTILDMSEDGMRVSTGKNGDNFANKSKEFLNAEVSSKLPSNDYIGSNLVFEDEKGEKVYRLQMLLKGLVKEAVEESNALLAEDIKESIIKEMDYQFRMVAEEQEKQQIYHQKQQEEYFEKLDYMITDKLQNRRKRTVGIVHFTGKEKKKKKD